MTEAERNIVLDLVPAGWTAESDVPDLGAICERAGVDPSTVRDAFGDEHDLVDAWYARLVRRTVSGVQDLAQGAGLPLEDRLGALVYTLFDGLEDEQDFVTGTFRRHGAAWGSPFRDELARAIENSLGGPDVPSINRAVATFAPLRIASVEISVQAIELWLADATDGRERAVALVDRLIAFFSEVATNRIVERGLDLLRYAAGAGYIPFVGSRHQGTAGAKDETVDSRGSAEPHNGSDSDS